MLNKRILFLAVLGLTLAVVTNLHAQVTPAPQATRDSQPLKAAPIAPNTGLHATLGDITDSRTTGKFFEYLRVEIGLAGNELEALYGTSKPIITGAIDDTGKSLIKDPDKKEPLFWTLQKNEDNKKTIENTVDLLNPVRRATSVSVAGYINALNPKQDPASIYTVKNFLNLAGQSLLPKNLQQYGLEITVLTKTLADKMKQEKIKLKEESDKKKAANASDAQKIGQGMEQAFGKIFESLFSGFMSMGDNDLLFIVKDPKEQVAYLEVADENGTPIKGGNGRSMSQDKKEGSIHYTISYDTALPPTAQLKIYFATPKSLTRVPFKFESVPLP